jgi:hypothetical protein
VNVLAGTVLACLLLGAVAYGLMALRRRSRRGTGARDVASAQRRYLVENWSAVEEAAARSGMDAEQIAEVRRRLLGA